MAFSLSFEGLTRGNIRHIYSNKATHIFIPSLRPFGKSTQFLPQPLGQRFPPRFYDYYPAFNIGLPRAPAFDRMTAEKIQALVERMQKPISCQRERGRSKRSKDHERSRPQKDKVVRFRSPSVPPDSVSTEVKFPSQTVSESSDEVEVKVRSEEIDEEVKDSFGVEVKEEKLPKLKDNTSEKQKKQTVSNKKNKQNVKSISPPIKN